MVYKKHGTTHGHSTGPTRPRRAAHYPAHRRRRKRRARLAPVVLFFCVLFGTLGVVWLAPSAAEQEPAEPVGAGAEQTATPQNGDGFVLVLDAGHGGDDPGAVSADGTIYESTITREMLQRITALFEARQPGVSVVPTTAEGESVHSRADRAAVANALDADLLVSLHLNDNSQSSVNGFQVFAQPPRFATNAQSVEYAGLLSSEVAAGTGLNMIGGSGVYYMFFEDSSTPYPYEYTSAVIPGHESLDTYGILQHATCPAVLVEQWFITSGSDMAAMYNDAGMDAMAESVYRATCRYFGLEA